MTSRKSKKTNSECGIGEDDCNKRGKKYKKEDIISLAENCGVNIYKKNSKGEDVLKSIKELCADIVANEKNKVLEKEPDTISQMQKIDSMFEQPIGSFDSISLQPDIIIPIEQSEIVNEPKCGGKKTTCKKYYNKNNRKELEVLALKCGVSITKENGKPRSINDICEDIAEASEIANNEPIEISENQIFEPEIIVEDEPEPEKQESWTKKELEAKKLPELKDIAGTLGIKKTQKKGDLIDAIFAKNKKQVVNAKSVSPKGKSQHKMRTITDLIREKRDELSKILNIRTPDFCDPMKNIYCDDDNVCDIDKKHCISPQEATYKENKGKAESFVHNGKKLVGKKSSIDSFKEMMENYMEESGGASESKESRESPIKSKKTSIKKKAKVPITKKTMCQKCTFVNDPGSIECEICQSDLSDEEIKSSYNLDENTEIEEDPDDLLEEGVQITDIENIEDILREIQNKEDPTLDNLEGLDDAKKRLLMCLGLQA
jgi:hypothetical protein